MCRVHLLAETLTFLFHLGNVDIGFAEFVEITHGLIGCFLGIGQDLMSLFIGLADDTVTLFF